MKKIRGIGAALILMACVGVTFAVVIIITIGWLMHNPPEIITEWTNKIISAMGAKGADK